MQKSTIEIQKKLIELGYDLGKSGADGIAGKATKAAISAYQKFKGIRETGTVTEELLLALFASPTTSVKIREPYYDPITLDRIKTLHPKVRDEALQIYKEASAALTGKAVLRFAYTSRSFAEQNRLYAQGRTTPGDIVTWVRAGGSYHNFDLAVDIVLLIDRNGDGVYEEASWDMNSDFDSDRIPDWMEVVAIFKKYKWAWGGDWKKNKDFPHFEKPFGWATSQLLAKYNNKEFIPGTTYVRI